MIGSELVAMVFGAMMSPPDAKMYVGNASAYVDAYSACLEGNANCVRVMEKLLSEMGVGAAGLSGVVVGCAETVVSALPGVYDGAKELFVDGKPYVKAAAACVASPVECSTRGVHYLKNKKRRERERAARRSATAETSELEASWVNRRVAENRLASKKAELACTVMDDPTIKAMNEEAERSRVMAKAAKSAFLSEKALNDLGTVAPGSSVSQYEAGKLRDENEDLRYRVMLLEELAIESAGVARVVEVRKKAPVAESAPPMVNAAAVAERLRAVGDDQLDGPDVCY